MLFKTIECSVEISVAKFALININLFYKNFIKPMTKLEKKKRKK